jgi:hypothetical protein
MESHGRICDPAQVYMLQPGNRTYAKWSEGFSGSTQPADYTDIFRSSPSTQCTAWINEINSVLRKQRLSLFEWLAAFLWNSCAETWRADWRDGIQRLQQHKTNMGPESSIGGCHPYNSAYASSCNMNKILVPRFKNSYYMEINCRNQKKSTIHITRLHDTLAQLNIQNTYSK